MRSPGPLAIAAMAVLLTACACGSTKPASAARTVTLKLGPTHVAGFSPTPTAASPPTLTLPRLAGSRQIPWKKVLGGSLPVTSCVQVGREAVQVPQPITKVKPELVSRMADAGYQRAGTSTSTGPNYSISGVWFQAKSNAHLRVTLSFESTGQATDVGYWATDVLKPKAGAQCMSASG